MPISLPNFLQANTSNYGLPEDLLGTAIEGYKAAREPKKIAQEEQQRELYNALLGHEGQHAKDINRFYPRQQEQAIQKADTELDFQRPTAQAALESSLLSNADQRKKNEIQEKYGLSEAEAELLLKRAQANEANQRAKHAHLSHLTPTQKDALANFGSLTSPESISFQRRATGIMPAPLDDEGKEIPLPRNAVIYQGLGEGVKKTYTDKMAKSIERGEAAKIANDYLDKIKSISDEYPDLYKEFAYIAAHPDDEGRFSRFVDAQRDPKKKTALDLMRKYSFALVLAQAETSNQRATNQFRTMQTQTKPGAGMTKDTIDELVSSMKALNEPLANYADAATPFSGYAYIPFQAKNFQTPQQELSASLNNQNSDQEMVTIKNSKTGETKSVTRAEARKIGAIK